MGYIGANEEITCPKCGHKERYYYGFEHDMDSGTFNFGPAKINCAKCGERLYSWQELKFGDKQEKSGDAQT